MTFHEIRIEHTTDVDPYEERQRIIDAVPENNYVDVRIGCIVIKTPHIMTTIDALKADGFNV